MGGLIERIQDLERKARKLEPDVRQRHSWLEEITNYSDRFLDELDEMKAYDNDYKVTNIIREEGLIKEKGENLSRLLSLLERSVDKPGINPASGGHLGYIPGGGIFPSALGDFLSALTNRYAGIWFASPGAVELEHLLIRWMCDQIGYPGTSLGNLSSGGSIANLIAIVTARDAKKIGPNRVRKSVIYTTAQVHHSVTKAIRIAGLGSAQLKMIPVDGRFRMEARSLEAQITKDKEAGLYPFLVISSFGSTDAGAVDPSDEIADVTEKYDLWFHIDGAYGGFFLLSSLVSGMKKGVNRSDSFTIDPHKGLFLPYGTGAILFKDVSAVSRSHYYKANYMQDAAEGKREPDPSDLSPELSKHFRALRMWLPLRLFGLAPYRAALDEKILLCRYFYEKIGKAGFETGPFPELSVCLFRFTADLDDPNGFNKILLDMIHRDGRVFISSTTIEDTYWLRMAILNFRTHLKTVDLAIEVILTAKDKLSISG